MSSQAPDVSIIIVNWNTRQYLLDCISSLKRETRRVSLEIIVVDNGSEDGSQSALRSIYPDVSLIENNVNLGFSRANNIGLRIASGRLLCLVNTDVIALDHVVDKLADYLRAHPDVGVVGPRTVDRDHSIRENCRRFPTMWNAAGDYLHLKRLLPSIGKFAGRTLPPETFLQTHDAEVLSGCFMMVRREAMEEVGLLDEEFFFYGEDTDWCKRFSDAGWRIVYLVEAEAIHFGGGSSQAYPVKYYLAMERADLIYWRKYHSWPEIAAYIAMKCCYHATGAIVSLLRGVLGRESSSRLRARGHANNLVWLLTRRSLVE